MGLKIIPRHRQDCDPQDRLLSSLTVRTAGPVTLMWPQLSTESLIDLLHGLLSHGSLLNFLFLPSLTTTSISVLYSLGHTLILHYFYLCFNVTHDTLSLFTLMFVCSCTERRENTLIFKLLTFSLISNIQTYTYL